MLDGKRAVFFDAGYTLLEPRESVADVYLRAARELGADIPEQGFRQRLGELWYQAFVVDRPADGELKSSDELERDGWRRFTFDLAQPFPKLAALHSTWVERLFDHFDSPQAWRPMRGANALLSQLAKRGLIVGIISNWHSSLKGILEGHGLDKLCHFALISADVGRRKPHGEIFEMALSHAKQPASSCVHIGDSWRDDVEGARSVGITPILFAPQPPEQLADPGVPVIDCLTRLLPGSD